VSRDSCFGFRVPFSVSRVSGAGSRMPGFGFRISRVRILDSRFRGFGFRIPGSGGSDFDFRVQDSGLRVSGSGFRIAGLGFRISDCGYRRSGIREPCGFEVEA